MSQCRKLGSKGDNQVRSCDRSSEKVQLFHTLLLKEFVVLRQLLLSLMVYCDILCSLLFVLLMRGVAEYGGLMIVLGAEEKHSLVLEKRGWPCASPASHTKLIMVNGAE